MPKKMVSLVIITSRLIYIPSLIPNVLIYSHYRM